MLSFFTFIQELYSKNILAILDDMNPLINEQSEKFSYHICYYSYTINVNKNCFLQI